MGRLGATPTKKPGTHGRAFRRERFVEDGADAQLYSLIVRTTEDVGRLLTVGSDTSFLVLPDKIYNPDSLDSQ